MKHTPNATLSAIDTTPASGHTAAIAVSCLNDIFDELGRISAALQAIDMATAALPRDQQSAIQQVNLDALNRLTGVEAALSTLKAPVGSAVSFMTTAELLEANKTALAVRQVFNLQATRYRFCGAAGGEKVRAWATQQVLRLDEEIFALVMEMDDRDLSSDHDAAHERDIAIQESYDVLPFGNAFEVKVARRSAK